MDAKFDFILPYEVPSKKLDVNYAIDGTPANEDYDDIIVGGQPNDKDEVIDKYLNIKLIFDISTKGKCRGTVVMRSWVLYGRVIGCSHTNTFFVTR